MTIIQLTPDHATRLRAIRLRALRNAPDAFGSTYSREVVRAIDVTSTA